jgi:hypothetical protein
MIMGILAHFENPGVIRIRQALNFRFLRVICERCTGILPMAIERIHTVVVFELATAITPQVSFVEWLIVPIFRAFGVL